MNPSPPEIPQDKDSWADLAQNLFGIEFGNLPDADELVSDEDLDLDEPAETSEAADSAPEASDQPVAETPFEIDAGDEAVAEGGETDVVAAKDEESIKDDSSDPAAASEEEDAYWDALESWNWGEESEEAQSSSSRSGRSRTSQRGPRQERTPSRGSAHSRSSATLKNTPSQNTPPPESPPIASRNEYVEDSGFGAGILGDVSADSATSPVSGSEAGGIDTESAPVSNASETGGGERPARKRRRRRRRPSRAKSEPTEAVLSETSSAENPLPSEEPSGGTPGSESLATDSAVQAEKPSSRRRSSGPRRGSHAPKSEGAEGASAETSVDEARENFAEGQAELPPDDDEQVTSPKEKSSSYKDVPTWGEAISCLLQADQTVSRSSDPAGGSSGKTRRDSSRRSGRRRRSRP